MKIEFKENIEELLNELNLVLETVLTILLSITIYAIINKKGLLKPVFMPNEPITLSGLLGIGMGLYLLFKMAKFAKPASSLFSFMKFLYIRLFKKKEVIL